MQYEYAKDVNVSALDESLRAATFAAKYIGVVVDTITGPHSVTVEASEALTTGETDELDTIIETHDPDVRSTQQITLEASEFGAELFDRWNITFVSAGLLTASESRQVADVLSLVSAFARLGNLYDADDELGTIEPLSAYLTAATIQTIRNEIRTYLGLTPV